MTQVLLLLQAIVLAGSTLLAVLVLPVAPLMADTASVAAVTDERFIALGPIVAGVEGRFIGVAKPSASDNGGSGWTIVTIAGNGRIEPAASLPVEPSVVAGSLAVTRAASLDDGGMLLVGSVALTKFARATRAGWAAKVDARGAVLWSRNYDQEISSEGTAEQFNFAFRNGARSAVIGGTRASGETCADELSGFIRVVDLDTGASPAGAVRLPGKSRRGLVDGFLAAPDRLFLAGWQAEQRDGAQECPEGMWLVAANASGADAEDLHWPGQGTMMPMFVAADEGAGMILYARPLAAAARRPAGPHMQLFADMLGNRLRIWDIDIGTGRNGTVTPFGATSHALFQRSDEPAARIGLRLADLVGRCLGNIEIEAANREQLSLSGSAGLGIGAGIIYGTAASETRRGVWVASLQSPAPSPGTISLGPDAKGATWLQRVESGRTAVKIEIAAVGEVVISARQIEGDVDLYLTSESGQLIAISDNIAGAAERLALDLKPGSYTLAIVTNSAGALAQLSVSGRQATKVPGGASKRSLTDADAVATALRRLGYANAEPSQVETSYSEALAAFAVSQCLSDTQESEQRLMIAAARAQTREVRRFEAAARKLTQQAGRLTVSVRKDDEDEQLGYARRLRAEGSTDLASAVQVMFNAGEAILSGTNAPRQPRPVAASSSGTNSERFELTDLSGPMVWTNAADQRLLTVRTLSPIVFGSIEQPDGSIFQGLLGTMTFAKLAAQNQIRVSPEIGRVLRQTGQVALAHPNAATQHRNDIAWSSAVWSEQSALPGLELAWPVVAARQVSRGFGQAEGELANGALLAAGPGKRIVAAHDGVVLYAGDDFRKFKSSIVIEGENRIVSVYGFSGRTTLATGKKVRKGEEIAAIDVESTGPDDDKLYFELRRGPTAVDPAGYFTERPIAAVDDRQSPPPKAATIPENVPSIVYFSSDDATLTSEAEQSLRAQAAWLKGFSQYGLSLEGHDDERSSVEDAIKLGQKRADTVRDYLIARGVDSARLRTISHGKAKPVSTCGDISCFPRDRRVESVLISKRELSGLPKIMNAPAKAARVATPAPPVPAPAAPRAKPAPAPDAPDASDAVMLGWPAKGRIIEPFGMRADNTHSDGINIAVPMGTPVHAAESAVVAYAGSELKGYGNLVLLRHDNGFVTAYAHNEEMLVKRGDKVKRGQVIAKSGKTGTVDQPQVHFEVRKGSKPVDPMLYLAK